MIQQGVYMLPMEEDFPGVLGFRRAIVECGCSCIIGRRLDNHELSTTMLACTEDHQGLVDRANDLLMDSLDRPTDFLLVTIVETYLNQAYEEWEEE